MRHDEINNKGQCLTVQMEASFNRLLIIKKVESALHWIHYIVPIITWTSKITNVMPLTAERVRGHVSCRLSADMVKSTSPSLNLKLRWVKQPLDSWQYKLKNVCS